MVGGEHNQGVAFVIGQIHRDTRVNVGGQGRGVAFAGHRE